MLKSSHHRTDSDELESSTVTAGGLNFRRPSGHAPVIPPASESEVPSMEISSISGADDGDEDAEYFRRLQATAGTRTAGDSEVTFGNITAVSIKVITRHLAGSSVPLTVSEALAARLAMRATTTGPATPAASSSSVDLAAVAAHRNLRISSVSRQVVRRAPTVVNTQLTRPLKSSSQVPAYFYVGNRVPHNLALIANLLVCPVSDRAGSCGFNCEPPNHYSPDGHCYYCGVSGFFRQRHWGCSCAYYTA